MATVLQIGPIVGHTTDQTTRVWFLPEDRTKTYVVRLWEYPHGEDELAWRWEKGAGTFTRADGLGLGASPSAKEEAVAPPSSRPASGDVFGTRIAYFKGLKSATRYFYDVVEAGDVGVGPPLLAPSLRTLPDATAIAAHDDGEDPTKPRFAYVSCAGLDLLPGLPGTPANGPNAPESLLHVALVNADTRVDYLLLGGDQIYAFGGGVAKTDDLTELRDEYPRCYRRHWSQKTGDKHLAALMAHVPTLAMWDDHDIYDGYGSHGDEGTLNGSQPARPIPTAAFQAASEAFEAYQNVLNPEGLYGAGPRHYGWALRVGRTAVLAPDLRSCRRWGKQRFAVIGDAQWQDLQRWLDDPKQTDVERLVVLVSVPIVFAPKAPDSALLFGARDDVRDQWSSRANLPDRDRLVGRLFEWRCKGAKRTGAQGNPVLSPRRVFLLGGDVHGSGFGTISSRETRFLRGSEEQADLWHGFSSPYTTRAAPVGWPLGDLLQLLAKQEVMGIGAESAIAKIDQIFNGSSFALIEPRREGKAWFELYIGGSRTPSRHGIG